MEIELLLLTSAAKRSKVIKRTRYIAAFKPLPSTACMLEYHRAT
jgi:hypothetical protein